MHITEQCTVCFLAIYKCKAFAALVLDIITIFGYHYTFRYLMIPLLQLTVQTNSFSIQDPSAVNHVRQSDSPIMARHEVQNGALFQGQTALYSSKVDMSY